MRRLYFDHAAATPVRPEVTEAMAEVATEAWGNPSSPHREGRAARRHLEGARHRIAAALGTASGGILFTRGGTESANLAILGRGALHPGAPVGVSTLEHTAVAEAARALEQAGHPVERIPVSPEGIPDATRLSSFLATSPTPALLSIQAVNSESGLVLELEGAMRAARDRGVPLHVDASQAVHHLPASLPPLLTLTGSKFGGPRGTGVLVRDEVCPLAPLLHGGKQERGFRAGTEDVQGAVGLATALELALAGQEEEGRRLEALRNRLEAALVAGVPGLRIVGGEPGARRAPHLLLVALPDLPRDLLPGVADRVGVAASAGSACRSGSSAPSAAFLAQAGPDGPRLAPLRLSLGWSTTEAEIEEAAHRLVEALRQAVALFGAGPTVLTQGHALTPAEGP